MDEDGAPLGMIFAATAIFLRFLNSQIYLTQINLIKIIFQI